MIFANAVGFSENVFQLIMTAHHSSMYIFKDVSVEHVVTQ